MDSIWNNLQDIKSTVAGYAKTAEENGWIDEDTCKSILEKLENDKLTIGVIGQMKCGKSTFLNAFLFKDEVLPTASTPMTAALSVITYGEKREVIPEFYSKAEWQEIESNASLNAENPTVQAAKELVDNVKKSKSREKLMTLLGSAPKSDSFSNLVQYVGADGEYTAITKFVTVKYPDERLKGVEIVDTPGFNDPVVSREERTKEFLAKADVVIYLLYAGRAFDKTDKEILFEKVRNVGPGKIVIGVNKYDLAVEHGTLEDEIREYAIKEINKAVTEANDVVVTKLLKDSKPILLSANMALLALMPLSEIMVNKDKKYHYEQYLHNFDYIKSQEDLLKESRINDLEKEIDKLLSGDKMEILVRKPLHEIQAKIDAKNTEFSNNYIALNSEKENLSLNDDDLEEKLKSFNKAKRKIAKEIADKEAYVKEFVASCISDTMYKIKQDSTMYERQIDSRADNKKTKLDMLRRELEDILRQWNFSLEDRYRKLHLEMKNKFTAQSSEIMDELGDILKNCTDDEEISKDYINQCRKELEKFNNMSFKDLFTGIEQDEPTFAWVLVPIAGAFLYNLFKNDERDYYRSQCKEMLNMDKVQEAFAPVNEKAQAFIEFFKTRFLEELLKPIIEQIESIEKQGTDRQQTLEKVEKQLLELKEKKEIVVRKLEEVNKYIKALPI
jgi:GTPase Era involved in 16S rRNA processing